MQTRAHSITLVGVHETYDHARCGLLTQLVTVSPKEIWSESTSGPHSSVTLWIRPRPARLRRRPASALDSLPGNPEVADGRIYRPSQIKCCHPVDKIVDCNRKPVQLEKKRRRVHKTLEGRESLSGSRKEKVACLSDSGSESNGGFLTQQLNNGSRLLPLSKKSIKRHYDKWYAANIFIQFYRLDETNQKNAQKKRGVFVLRVSGVLSECVSCVVQRRLLCVCTCMLRMLETELNSRVFLLPKAACPKVFDLSSELWLYPSSYY